ncbi:MAG: ISAs1 family transposase, partial [Myxococcales bacterium]|nr:ISAs1 family transposase [Myxococcales bacterium]
AQCKTAEKSNEITAIPELLAIVDLRGATETIEALGCQRAIARPIVDSGGNYLLAVKENQPTLHQEIVETSDDIDDDGARSLEEESKPEFEDFIEIDKGL